MKIDSNKKKNIQKNLLRWYGIHKREMPWRTQRNPYATFVSEVMLQQTQVKTVIPYFHKWMNVFPTVEKLANADLEKVLKLWEGLGYYSRARNLHKAAKLIVEKHAGKIPDDVETLLLLPGIGRYTAGAIASIAFEKPAPIVDGNVARVLSRIFLIKKDILNSKTQKELYELAGALVSSKNPGDFNQALMELGSLVCFPDLPNCHLCPISKVCLANKKGMQETLPIKSKALVRKSLTVLAGIVRNNGKVLVHKRPLSGIWGGLWEIPSVLSSKGETFLAPQKKTFEASYGIKIKNNGNRLPALLHRLTHLDMTIHPHILETEVDAQNICHPERSEGSTNIDSSGSALRMTRDIDMRWVSKKEVGKLSFPVPHQKILNTIFQKDVILSKAKEPRTKILRRPAPQNHIRP